jgi:hypothetical protein
MQKAIIALLFGSLVAACGGSAADEAMAKLKTKKDKICACKDVACAEKADEEYDKWMEANMKRLKGAEPSDSFKKKFKDLEHAARDCMDKLEEAAAPKPADPAPTPAEPPPAAPPAADPAAPAAPTP